MRATCQARALIAEVTGIVTVVALWLCVGMGQQEHP